MPSVYLHLVQLVKLSVIELRAMMVNGLCSQNFVYGTVVLLVKTYISTNSSEATKYVSPVTLDQWLHYHLQYNTCSCVHVLYELEVK